MMLEGKDLLTKILTLLKSTKTWAAKKDYVGFGAEVNIESYTSKAAAYTIPSDGIIHLQCRYTSGNYIGVTVCNSDGTNEMSVQIIGAGTGNTNTCIPVFKGMKAWRSSNNGQYNYINFRPYILGGYYLAVFSRLSGVLRHYRKVVA